MDKVEYEGVIELHRHQLLPIANHYSKQFTCFRHPAAYPKRQRSKLSGEAEPGMGDFRQAGVRDLRREWAWPVQQLDRGSMKEIRGCVGSSSAGSHSRRSST